MATIKVPTRTRTGDIWNPIAPEPYRKKRCGGGSCGSHGGTSGGGCGHKSGDDSCGDCHSCPVSAMTEGDRETVHRALMKAGYAGDRDHVPQLPDDWESDEDDGSAAAAGQTRPNSREAMDTSTHMTTEDIEATGGPGAMQSVIAVRFPDSGKLYYYDPVDLDPKVGEWVVVETPRGKDAAKVFVARQQVTLNRLADPLPPLVRLLRPEELQRMERLGDDAANALRVCTEKVIAARLPMKLIKAEYSFDATRLTFYFTSESRVDFRTLVRELAVQFRARIELRQVGARDEARLLGGVGRCGLTLCCATWLPDYPPTSIKQAKEQDLPLNPAKISGVCGRLLCCLSYEYDTYVALRRNLPRIGQRYPTPEGEGRVIAVQVLKQSVRVALDEGGVADVEIGDPTDRKWQGEEVVVEPPPIPDRYATGDTTTQVSHEDRPDAPPQSRQRPPDAPQRSRDPDRRADSGTGSDRPRGATRRDPNPAASVGGGEQTRTSAGEPGVNAAASADVPGTRTPSPPSEAAPTGQLAPPVRPAAAEGAGESARRRRRGRGNRKPNESSSPIGN